MTSQATPHNFHTRQLLTQKVFDEACVLHRLFAENRPGGRRADFSYKDLSRLSMAGRNLSGANFTGAMLIDVDAEGVNLRDAELFCANMSGARLVGANLQRANLRGSVFRGADLTRADLTQADMRDGGIATKQAFGDLKKIKIDTNPTDARAAKFVEARLEKTNMSGMVAQNADFSDAVMRGAVLDRVNLKNAVLDGADLEGASLVSAKIEGASFRNAHLKDAAIDAGDMRLFDEIQASAAVYLPPPPQAEIDRMLADHVAWVSSSGRQGAQMSLAGVDLRERSFGERPFLPAAKLARCYLGYMDLRGAMLTAADLTGCDFRSADLSGADLRGAKLKDVNFAHTIVEGAKMDALALVSGQQLETVRQNVHVVDKGVRP